MDNQKGRIQKFLGELSATGMTDRQAAFLLSPDSVYGEYTTNTGDCDNSDKNCAESHNSGACQNSGGFCKDTQNGKGCVNSSNQSAQYPCSC